MAGTSFFKIAEQCRVLLDKGAIQDYISSCVDAYSLIAKKEWYENKAEGVSEIDGSFVYTFAPEIPELDETRGEYYLTLQSSYLRLPHEMGIVFIGYPKSSGFVRITSGSSSMYDGLKSDIMGGNQTYYIDGMRAYFPKMKPLNVGGIQCRLAIAYDAVNPDEQLNIPRSMITQIIDMVVAKYAPQPQSIEEKIK